MKSLIIACQMNQAEISEAMSKAGCTYPVLYLASALHNQPDLLKAALQKELDRAEKDVQQVLLAMGYCGNAVIGLRSRGFRIVLPRADDCITLLLGSPEKRKEIMGEAATCFFTKGWLEAEGNIFEEYARTAGKYGESAADMILEMMYAHYERLGLIDTGAYQLADGLGKIAEAARLIKRRFEILPGTLSFLQKLFTGPYEDDEFLVVEPDGMIRHEDVFRWT